MKLTLYVLTLLILVGCGCSDGTGVYNNVPKPNTSRPEPVFQDVIIHATAQITLTTTQKPSQVAIGAIVEGSGTVNVSVTNNASQTMTLGSWTNPSAQTPTSGTTLIDFGNATVASLFDNNLNVCPSNPAPHKCTTAGFAAYMSTNAGLVNGSDASQIMPIEMSGPLTTLTALATTSPGLFLETISITSGHNTVKLSDFGAAANTTFDVQGDFVNAGAGTYTGTINVVFFLAN